MSKLFISFLGTNPYLECKYKMNGEEGPVVKYVQERLIDYCCRDWTCDDKFIFFLTDEARKNNWLNSNIKDTDTKEVVENIGLCERLKRLELNCQIIPVTIPIGNSEEEMWNIFSIIFNCFEENDEVIFDVTHSFRSLPIFLSVMLNYARVLKNIKVKAIYYGAFETLGRIYEVKKILPEKRIAPIFNLSNLAHLQNWTNAIDNYINYGVSENISKLINEKIAPVLKETKGKDIASSSMRKLSNLISKISDNFGLCRGKYIREFNFTDFKETILSLNELSIIEPLKPLLYKISEKFSSFSDASVINNFYSVEYCFKHGLYQQSLTILQESIISYYLEKYKYEVNSRDNRENFSSTLKILLDNIDSKEWRGNKEKIANFKNLFEKEDNYQDILKFYDKISYIRNDVNHCGEIEPIKISKIKKSIQEQITNMFNLLNIRNVQIDSCDLSKRIVIANAFSVSMLQDDVQLKYSKINVPEIKELLTSNEVYSIIGHQSTAEKFSELLDYKIKYNRIDYNFQKKDIIIVGAINKRLKEGQLLDNNEIETITWWKIEK